MKQCLLLLTLLSLASYSFSQANDSPERLQDHYLRIGKHEATIGTAMLGGGLVLILANAFVSFKRLANDEQAVSSFNYNLGITTLLIGDISTLASIPVFIVAGTHKSKARHLSLAMQKSDVLLRPGGISPVFQPVLTLTFDLLKRKQRD